MIIPYQLHPKIVHFPIALLIAGGVCHVIGLIRKEHPWIKNAAHALLLSGTVMIWAAIAAGLLAERTMPNVTAGWPTFEKHEEAAYWTAGLFSLLSIVKLILKDRFEKILTLFWFVAIAALLMTAHHGGQLVYNYGMGVNAASALMRANE